MAKIPQVGKESRHQDIGGFYDQIAADYDAHDNTTQFLAQDWLTYSIIKSYDLSHVIDLGCGTGRAIDWLELKSYQYEGADISREMITRARLKHPNYLFTIADLFQYRPAFEPSLIISLYGSPSYVAPGVLHAYLSRYRCPIFLGFFGKRRNWKTYGAQMELKHGIKAYIYSSSLYFPFKPTNLWYIDNNRLTHLPLLLYKLKLIINLFTNKEDTATWILMRLN